MTIQSKRRYARALRDRMAKGKAVYFESQTIPRRRILDVKVSPDATVRVLFCSSEDWIAIADSEIAGFVNRHNERIL
jgi:hypothetical protein